MCYSVHFYKVLINIPTNAQPILLYNDKPTCFGPLRPSPDTLHPTYTAKNRTCNFKSITHTF